MSLLRLCALLWFGVVAASWGLADAPSGSEPQFVVRHPLDPLTPEELATAVEVVKGQDISKSSFFPYVYLNEPSKDIVLNYAVGASFPREAYVVVLDWEKNAIYEAIVDVHGRRIKSWAQIADGQPPLLNSEQVESIYNVIKQDSRWQKAMKDRGLTQFDELEINMWAPGEYLPDTVDRKKRLVRFLTYWKGPHENIYSNPVEGVVGIFDLNSRQVVDLKDYGIVPVAKVNADFDAKTVGPDKFPLRPLIITQPEGVSFKVQGNEVEWYRWKFRFSLHPREGLVLHRISYDGRPILYRAGVSEIVVPYGDPSPAWGWRTAVDMSEYMLGNSWSPIVKGQDVPDNAVLLDAPLTSDTGVPFVAKSSIAIYEEDGGVLWRHDHDHKVNSHRSRALVIQFYAVLDNYDYALSWAFYPDGRIEPRVDLLGVLLQKGTATKEVGATQHEDLIAPGVMGPMHQHFLCYRLDFEVDGPVNSVVETVMRALKGKENPYLNGFIVEEYPITNEGSGRQRVDEKTLRSWKVISSSTKNELGQATGYDVMPMPTVNSFPFIDEESPAFKKFGFIQYQLWVTKYSPLEMYPAGKYPYQGPANQGLPEWTRDNGSLVDQDIVVWYVFGVTHHTGAEEWPIMPGKHIVPFVLKPSGFFSRNPVLDFGNAPSQKQ